MATEVLADAHIAQCEVCKETGTVRTVLSGPYIQTAFLPKRKGIRHCARCYFKSIKVLPEAEKRKLEAQYTQHESV